MPLSCVKYFISQNRWLITGREPYYICHRYLTQRLYRGAEEPLQDLARYPLAIRLRIRYPYHDSLEERVSLDIHTRLVQIETYHRRQDRQKIYRPLSILQGERLPDQAAPPKEKELLSLSIALETTVEYLTI